MTDLVVPTLGESITEAIIGKWLIAVGEHVQQDEPVVDLETDKITIQVTAPCSGALTLQNYAEGDTVNVGDIIGALDETQKGTVPAQAESTAAASAPAAAPAPTPAPQPAKAKTVEAASSAPLPARDSSGNVISPAGRQAIRQGKAKAPVAATGTTLTPAVSGERPAEVIVPMSPLRRRIAERLILAQHSTASLTTFNEVDMSAIIAMRKEYKDDFLETHGIKLGFMSFAVKASVEALKLFPGVNAEIRDTAIVYKNVYDLGIAVGTPKGLVVPVIRDCDKMNFADVEQSIIDIAMEARSNKLVLSDLLGGTFTITNGGIYGSMMSTPLLNFPQTGILGLHNIVKRPIVGEGDKIEVRPMMYLALTYDHRVVDGKEAVQFLVAVKERMENPSRLLFGV
ncbi:MAG: 2-oxoglutarate dehydrogenase complex dihydrolipoyllysine-residue succinyltransferase [Kofleriaceae bacterium]|nr:2-oxoglutarate dehydrogenase complex dihydrolipoyllysine-residue succinyltransferase [Kofleriaceae bacterium]